MIIAILYLLHLTLSLVFYSTSLLLLSYHTMNNLRLISLAIYLCAPVACVHDTIFSTCLWFRFIDTRVFIFPRHLEFGAWSLWILSVVDLRGATVVWIPSRPSRALSFRVPCASLEFSFCKLVSAICTIHACISPCILAFAPIGDVIFLKYCVISRDNFVIILICWNV